MARLEVDEGVRRAGEYSHVVVSYVDDDGYPVSVAGPFSIDAATDSVVVGPLGLMPGPGREVCLIFSHIRPRPGVGYDQRRYVNLWGTAEPASNSVAVRVSRAHGWDEAERPFIEYIKRAAPTGLAYLSAHGNRSPSAKPESPS